MDITKAGENRSETSKSVRRSTVSTARQWRGRPEGEPPKSYNTPTVEGVTRSQGRSQRVPLEGAPRSTKSDGMT